jgi:hypothetical protein
MQETFAESVMEAHPEPGLAPSYTLQVIRSLLYAPSYTLPLIRSLLHAPCYTPIAANSFYSLRYTLPPQPSPNGSRTPPANATATARTCVRASP